MSKHILITGGSGLIGRALTHLLLMKGYAVSHMSRGRSKDSNNIRTFLWNVEQGIIDQNCIQHVDVIVHLAGEGIADKRWTRKRQQQLIVSRTQSISLIYELLKEKVHSVKAVIAASAIGYYSDRGDELLTEKSHPHKDFLARCCIEWERSVEQGQALGLRVLKLRTGIVLSKEGGMLKYLLPLTQLGLGTILGTGQQWVSWIHWKDLIHLYLFGIEQKELEGVYNAVAPNPVRNVDLTKTLAQLLHKPLWMPRIPAFFLNPLLGEMAIMLLGSTKVSSERIQQAGFNYQYTNINDALQDIVACKNP